MRVSVQTTTGLERRMEVQVPAARVQQEVEARLRSVGRAAKIQGFRPGKVPPAIIRQRFGTQIHQEVVEDLVKRSFAEAIIEQKLAPAGGPRIEPVSTLVGQDLKYTATFEVYPQVEIKGLDTLQVERQVVEVSDPDIDAMLEHLRQQRPNWKSVERPAQSGDKITIDFEGRIDGVPFEGGKGENIPVVLGGGNMLEDLEKGLEGLEVGADKTIAVKFPENYRAEQLAGKAAEFAVKVRSVEAPELPELDEEFCKAFGVQEGGVERLRSLIAENMRGEVEQNVRARMRKQALDALLASNKVELPSALVDAQINEMQVDWGRRAGVYEVEKIPPRDAFEETAKRRVSLGLLIGEIINQQQLKADPAKVEQRLRATVAAAHDAHAHHHDSAHQHQQHLHEMMQAYRRDSRAMRQIESLVLEEQAIEWLLAQAKTVDKPISFKEFTSSTA